MGTIRVTQGLMVQRALNNINRQTRRLMVLQEQLATGLKVNRPSDDPLAVRRAINIRVSMAEDEQYLTNISSMSPQLTETETTIQNVIDNLQRARELTLQGANTTLSQLQLDQIAVEVNQILETVVMDANHQTNGRYIFSGTRTLQAAFTPTRDADGNITSVAYQGNDGLIQINIAEDVTTQINEPGSATFTSSQDIFQMLIDIRDNLRSGNQAGLQESIAELNTSQDQLLLSLARIGAIQNRLENLSFNTEDFLLQLEATLSDNIDADYAETVLNLNAESNAFQAALNAAAQVIQPSLLNFLS